MNFDIDFVIDWVDGNDEGWQEKKSKYMPKADTDNRAVRYRDWETLKYWFRAVEKYASWVHRIFFVVDNQVPDWLDVDNPRVVIVNHSDYIPEKFLPVFNSDAIELGINKIPGLSEHFVFFNDDFFINDFVNPDDFFDSNGLPRDSGVLSAQIPKKNSITHITTNNLEIINEYFNRKDVLRHIGHFIRLGYGRQNIKTITSLVYPILLGFQDFHIPISFRKSSMDYVWTLIEDELEGTIGHRFRSNEDLNIFLFRYFQLLSGNFSPRKVSFGKYYDLSDQNEAIFQDLVHSKHKVIVLNDQENIQNFTREKAKLSDIFEQKFSDKSYYEK
ncbi:hypothetical protein PY76_13730 [Lacticaseibacillus rhamnosus]|uniref:Stealth CR1 domain-containing protein n=1 Tax=Lacticaseibacillus rhamnosus TaxID=47715 RepID=UPI0007DF10B8|nr:Stealth CR1 domain-containing protein [Lacticaseibacillus rhamnosus]OAU08538.1 hypothetical protein PY76_13730 [Lacticaseibacillus rhamnosus]